MKIFVTYSNTPNCYEFGDKPHEEFLKKPDVFVPVLGGKANYKGKSTFFNEMQGDDTGTNISKLNPFINEHSVIYWAANNLDKFENEEWFGFCHYRRLFDVPDGEELDKDTIYANITELPLSNMTYFMLNHSPETTLLFSQFVNNFVKYNLPLVMPFSKFLDSKTFYSANLFIMHKNNFKKYCGIMLPLLNILKTLIFPRPNTADRSASFILERLTTFALMFMAQVDKNLKIKQGKYLKLDETLRT